MKILALATALAFAPDALAQKAEAPAAVTSIAKPSRDGAGVADSLAGRAVWCSIQWARAESMNAIQRERKKGELAGVVNGRLLHTLAEQVQQLEEMAARIGLPPDRGATPDETCSAESVQRVAKCVGLRWQPAVSAMTIGAVACGEPADIRLAVDRRIAQAGP